MVKSVFYFLIFLKINSQNNPICWAKWYQCSPDTLENDICAVVKDKHQKFIYLQPCSNPEYWCPLDTLSYESPSKCTKIISIDKLLPGEKCSDSNQCLNKKCVSGICEGTKI